MKLETKELMACVWRPRLTGLFLFLTSIWSLPATAELRSELRWSSDSFLSPAYDQAGPGTSQFVGAAFHNIDPEADLRVDLRGAYASGSPLLSYFNVKEFSYQAKINRQQQFAVGRRKVDWSELDRRWNYGLIEPVFKWNPLDPESQGLTGFFWQTKAKNLSLTLFGSFFFIPEQGASFEIDSDGRFVRGNPWFRRPPDTIRIFSQVSQIEYNFDRPREADIVFQPSYGAKLELFADTPWLLRLSGFYKPMNQLALGYDGVLDIPRDRGSVEIMPSVIYHQVLAADLVYRSSRFRVGASGIYDLPSTENTFEERWTRPVFSEATILSPFVDVLLSSDWTLRLQRLQVFGEEVAEEGPLADPSRASITSRYPYREANEVGIEYSHSVSRSRSLDLRSSYMWSDENSFQLIRLGGRLALTNDWSIQSELNLVQAEELSSTNRNDIAEFRNNDRFVMGVGYAF